MQLDPQKINGMGGVGFDEFPGTKEALRAKTKHEKVIAYYGLMCPNPQVQSQPYNVNNTVVWKKLGVGTYGDCIEPMEFDTQSGNMSDYRIVSPKEEHEQVLKEYCNAVGLGLVENENDKAQVVIPTASTATGAKVKTNALGLPTKDFIPSKEDVEPNRADDIVNEPAQEQPLTANDGEKVKRANMSKEQRADYQRQKKEGSSV